MWQVSRVSIDGCEGLVGYGRREVKVGSRRVCSQGLGPSDLTKRGGRGGESQPVKAPDICFSSFYSFLIFSLFLPLTLGVGCSRKAHAEVRFSVNHREGSRALGLIFHWKKPSPGEGGEDW